MKEFKGTKTPFLLDGNTLYSLHTVKFGEGEIETNRFYCAMYADQNCKEAVKELSHNMKLLKAAPDLLQVCQDLVKTHPWSRICENAQLAIDKALGDG